MSCAWVPGQKRSWRDGGPSPGFIPSGTAPTYQAWTLSTFSCLVTRGIVTEGSVLTCLTTPLPRNSPQYPRPTPLPMASRDWHWSIHTLVVWICTRNSKRRDNTINCWGVVGGKVTSDNVPLPLPRSQLKYGDVESELMDHFHQDPWVHPVEHHYSAVA